MREFQSCNVVAVCVQFSAATSSTRGEEKFDSETLPKRWAATARLQARVTVLQHQLQQQGQQLNLFTTAAAGSGSKEAAGLPSPKPSSVISAQRQPLICCAFHPLLPQLLAGADDGNVRVRPANKPTTLVTVSAHLRCRKNHIFGVASFARCRLPSLSGHRHRGEQHCCGFAHIQGPQCLGHRVGFRLFGSLVRRLHCSTIL